MNKLILLYVCLHFMPVVMSQERTIKLFPEGTPEENIQMVEKSSRDGNRVAGETVFRVTNVSEPAISIYRPSEELANGSAMIVCPGGGYDVLAYDLEGDEVCLWLNELGITAVLLKYRVPKRKGRPVYEAPLEDFQRAISYLRTNADELNLDSDRIGVVGFSAGAHLAVMACNSFQKRTYPIDNNIDKVSCRPSFCLLVYPAYLQGGNLFSLSPEIHVSSKTPPTMIIQTQDDRSYIDGSLFYYYALKEAEVPVWMYLYSKGGHGYGLRDTGVVVNSWPDRVEDWFRELGVIATE